MGRAFKQQITDYAVTAGKLRNMLRAAQAIIKTVESAQPPHRLLLGNDAFEAATAKPKNLNKEFLAWESVSRGADYPT